MLAFKTYTNTEAAVCKMCEQLGIGIDPKDVATELEKHPDNPSILAISDVLNWFNIDTAAYHVEGDELIDVPTPFIAHTNRNNDFVVISKITDKSLTLSDNRYSTYKLSLADFKKIYSGVVLTARSNKTSKNIKLSLLDRLSIYKTPASLLGLAFSFILTLLLFTNFLTNFNMLILGLAFIKTGGLIIGILLLIQSIDKNNPLVQAMCGGTDNTNCNTILTSRAAIIFKGLTWSEVGFFYFAGTWLATLFVGRDTGILQLLTLLNLISLPYTIYSINFQARIAKQWCILCTAIQALLWLEAILFVLSLTIPLVVTLSSILKLMACVSFPISSWMLLKPIILKTQELRTLKAQTKKFKYNKKLFEAALNSQPKCALPAEEWSIVLGNVEANIIIIMVSNPYCPPCSKTHDELDELLNKLDDIQLRIVFTASNNEDDPKTLVTKHIMALNELPDKTIVKQALHSWYAQKQKNYENWAKLYPVILDRTEYDKLDKQREWCKMAEIKATPTLLINGFRLPEVYRLHDIRYMLQ